MNRAPRNIKELESETNKNKHILYPSPGERKTTHSYQQIPCSFNRFSLKPHLRRHSQKQRVSCCLLHTNNRRADLEFLSFVFGYFQPRPSMCVRTLIDQSPLILLHHGTGPYCVISCLNISAHLLFKALTLVFAVSGIFIGAVTGALADSTVNGVFRRIVLGAIVGAVAFVETLKSWQVHWTLDQSQSDSLPFVRGFFHDLISGRMVHEFLIPAISGAHQWQINIREMTYEDIFDALIPLSTGYAVAGGAPLELLNGLPKHAISQAEEFDSNGEPHSCSICLQEFQRGETARSLPKCSHTFHMGCVDQWLVKHALCPLCRQYV